MSEKKPRGCLAEILSLFGIDIGEPEEPTLPFRLRDDFLSSAELSFYRVLQSVVSERSSVCCKVNLADIFFVLSANENQSYRNKINRKHVDFLLCDPVTMTPQCGVELDDASHDRQKRVERDAFVNQVFAAAGLPLVHIPVQTAYNPAKLLAIFEPHLVPRIEAPSLGAFKTLPADSADCPKCGVSMVQRVAKKGPNIGKKFLACPNYPRCKAIRAMEE